MTDILPVLNKLKTLNSFTRADVSLVMEQCGYNATESTVNHAVSRMLEDRNVVRIGRNRYRIDDKLTTYAFPHSELAVSLAGEIISSHPYLDFRIFELVQLNEFVNHQIANNIIFVSIEAGLEEDVFNTLWESHHGSALLKPGTEELFRYLSEDMIVICKLATESPKGKPDFWDTRLEKLLVDIAVDKLLKSIVYSGEYPAIYREAMRKYAIDKSVMTRYLRRRGALQKFREFLQNEAGISQEELSI